MTATVQLREQTCITCAITYAMPQTLYNRHYERGGYHYCPNGHQQGWGRGSKDREEGNLKNKLFESNRKLALAISQKDQLHAELINTKSVHEQFKKRMTNGVCPCCNRTFTNLARHMKTKHPNEVSKER